MRQCTCTGRQLDAVCVCSVSVAVQERFTQTIHDLHRTSAPASRTRYLPTTRSQNTTRCWIAPALPPRPQAPATVHQVRRHGSTPLVLICALEVLQLELSTAVWSRQGTAVLQLWLGVGASCRFGASRNSFRHTEISGCKCLRVRLFHRSIPERLR